MAIREGDRCRRCRAGSEHMDGQGCRARVRREGRLVGQGREEPQRDRRGASRTISSLKKSKTDKKTAS